MPPQDRQFTQAQHARRLDELHLFQGQHTGPRQPRERRRVHDADSQHRVDDPCTQNGHDANGQQDRWKREEHVHAAHGQTIQPAAQETGQQASGCAEYQRQADRNQPDFERDTCAKDDPAQDVAAELIGTEHEVFVGREQLPVWMCFLRAVRRHEWREDGEGDARQDDGRAGHTDPVARKATRISNGCGGRASHTPGLPTGSPG